MTIKAGKIVIGKQSPTTTAENTGSAPQDKVKTTEPKVRPEKIRLKSAPPQTRVKTEEPKEKTKFLKVQHDSPQDHVSSEMLSEPKVQGVRNGFIVQNKSKFHSDMKNEDNN
jgi:hypothetical protein